MALENNNNKEEENIRESEEDTPEEQPKAQPEKQSVSLSQVKPEQIAVTPVSSPIQPSVSANTPPHTKKIASEIPTKDDILIQPEDLSVAGQVRAAKAKLPPQQKDAPPPNIVKEEKHPVKHSSSFIKPLRTYKNDIAEVLAKGKTSLVNIVTAEHKRKQKKKDADLNKPSKEKEPKKYRAILKSSAKILGSIVLIIMGIAAMTYMYVNKGDKVIVQTEIFSPVFSEHQVDIDITDFSRRKLMNTLVKAQNNTSATLNSITNYRMLVSDEAMFFPVSARDFLKILRVGAPNSFLRSLRPQFMFAIHVFDGNEPFFVFETLQYEEAFAGMLEWEKTIERDLSPLFKKGVYPDIPTEGTTTPSENVIETGFRDVVIKNKDTRVLIDGEGNTVLLYSFLDRETIIIVSNKDSFIEIITRISSTRILR